MFRLAVLLVVTICCTSIASNEHTNFVKYDIIEPSGSVQRICQPDDVCYYGYVKAEADSISAIFKAIPTW